MTGALVLTETKALWQHAQSIVVEDSPLALSVGDLVGKR